MKTIKVLKEDVTSKFPNSQWPCLEYSKVLIANGESPDSRLEIYEKDKLEWLVENIGKYTKFEKKLKHLKE